MCLLLAPGLVGHFIQLADEDKPWEDFAHWRTFETPGWHLFLPTWMPLVVAASLAGAAVGLFVRRTRPWMFAVCALYALHYVTYPYRIRNHMSHVLFELTMLGGVWLVGLASGAADVRGNGPRSRFVDRHAVTGMALVLCGTYVWAGLHKINANFLAQDATSSAVTGLTTFLASGHLGHDPPSWARRVATYGTVVVELTFPVLAWRLARARVPLVLGLMLFHFPHVSVMDVADYPMLASAFYPSIFSRGHFRLLRPHLVRPNVFNVTGVVVGVAAQIYFMQWWSALTCFGIFVTALWGWAAGAMVRLVVRSRRRPRARPLVAP